MAKVDFDFYYIFSITIYPPYTLLHLFHPLCNHHTIVCQLVPFLYFSFLLNSSPLLP